MPCYDKKAIHTFVLPRGLVSPQKGDGLQLHRRRKKPRRLQTMAVVSMKQLLEAGCSFRPPDQKMEPENGGVHLHRAQWNLYHRSAEDGEEAGRGVYVCARSFCERRMPFCLSAPRSRRRIPIKEEAERVGAVLCQCPLARRHADQLQHHPPQELTV